VVELFGGLPIADVVAALAVVSKLPFVWVNVAGQAITREPEKRLRKVLVFN
jgi:hypothetical protein